MTEDEHFRRKKPSNLVISAILLSVVMLFFSSLFLWVMPSNAGRQLVQHFVPEEYESIGLTDVYDIEISRHDNVVYMGSFESVQRFSLTNNSFLSPLTLNTSVDSGVTGAIDISVLNEGWGAVLFAGQYQGSMVRYLDDHGIGNYTSDLHHDTSNARFTRVANSYIHGKIFLGTDDLGVGIITDHNRNATFLNTTHGLPHNQITELKVRGNYLLIGTQLGFALYDIPNEKLISWAENDYGAHLQVISIEYYHTTQTVYVGNRDGLFIFRRTGDSFELARPRINSRSNPPLPSDEVYSLEIDEERNRLYIGTDDGLAFLKLAEDTFVHTMITEFGLEGLQIRDIRIGIYNRYMYLGTTLDWANRNPGSLFAIPLDYDAQISQTTTLYSIIGILCLLVVPATWSYVYIAGRVKELTDEDILRLIEQGEGYKTEFKETLLYDIRQKEETRIPKGSCMKTIAAFMNTCGGVLMIGVNDSGEIVGLEQDFNLLVKKKNRAISPNDQLDHRFEQLYDSFKLDMEFRVLVKRYFRTVNEKEVLVIHVQQSNEHVYIKKDGVFYRRDKKANEPVNPHEIRRFWKTRDRLCNL